MKKAITFLFSFLFLIFCIASAYSENSIFDYKMLSKYKGYKYDESKKEWVYQRSYTQHLEGMDVVVNVYLNGTNKRITNAPMLVIGVTDPEKKDYNYKAKTISFIIDGSTYTYKQLLNKGKYKVAYLGFEGYDLVNAFLNSDSISVLISLEESSKKIQFNINMKKFETTVKEICSNLIAIDIWDYLDDDAIDDSFEYEEKYPLIINHSTDQTVTRSNTNSNNQTNTPSSTKKKITLGDGKYIVGKDIQPGKYIITCIKSSAEDYKNSMDSLGSIFGALDSDNGDAYSGYFSALGSMVSAIDEGAHIEIIGDYGNVQQSFYLKVNEQKLIQIDGKVALSISDGTCELEKQ